MLCHHVSFHLPLYTDIFCSDCQGRRQSNVYYTMFFFGSTLQHSSDGKAVRRTTLPSPPPAQPATNVTGAPTIFPVLCYIRIILGSMLSSAAGDYCSSALLHVCNYLPNFAMPCVRASRQSPGRVIFFKGNR